MPDKKLVTKKPKKALAKPKKQLVTAKPKAVAAATKPETQQPKKASRLLRLRRNSDHPKPAKVPPGYNLFWKSVTILTSNWDLFLGVLIIYAIVNLLLVRGLAGSTNLTDVKSSIENAFHGHASQLTTGFALYLVLIGGSGNTTSATAGAYQAFCILIVSLAIIWLLRQIYINAQTIHAKDAFYKGVYPLIPVLLIVLVIGLESLPLLAGVELFGIIVGNQIVSSFIGVLLVGVACLLIALISIYYLTSSLIALYIVTLPDMTPWQALKSAKELVKHRRLLVIRRMLALPIYLLLISGIIMFPIIVFLTPIAQWFFFLLIVVGLSVTHSYMYRLYRELL